MSAAQQQVMRERVAGREKAFIVSLLLKRLKGQVYVLIYSGHGDKCDLSLRGLIRLDI